MKTGVLLEGSLDTPEPAMSRFKLPNLWRIVKKIVPLQKGPGKYPYFWKIELELYDSTNLKKNHIRVTSHLLL